MEAARDDLRLGLSSSSKIDLSIESKSSAKSLKHDADKINIKNFRRNKANYKTENIPLLRDFAISKIFVLNLKNFKISLKTLKNVRKTK